MFPQWLRIVRTPSPVAKTLEVHFHKMLLPPQLQPRHLPRWPRLPHHTVLNASSHRAVFVVKHWQVVAVGRGQVIGQGQVPNH